MEAPRMNRLRETVAPSSRRLLQITGRALQVAEGARGVEVARPSIPVSHSPKNGLLRE